MTAEPFAAPAVPSFMKISIAALLVLPLAAGSVRAGDFRETIAREARERAALPFPVVPLPARYEAKPGRTALAGATLVFPEKNDVRAAYIRNLLTKSFGPAASGSATITLRPDTASGIPEQGYRLTVDERGATIAASGFAGFFNGAVTLAQLRALAGTTTLPRCEIADAPRPPLRAVMLDLGRSYMPVAKIREYLDRFAAYKINAFHWHLTENNAWRFEVKSHPELTRAAFHDPERDPGKHYTQDEIREVIAYAKARNITVVPEIDIPGHSAALRRALGVKRMDDPKVLATLRDVFRELLALTPPEDTPFIHMGTDEAHGADERMSRESLAELAAMIEKSGRDAVAWKPGMGVVAGKGAIDMLWAQGRPGKNRFIDARSLYTNLNTGFDAVRTTYWNVPASDGDPAKRFGGELAQWLDLPTSPENIGRVSPFWPAFVTFADRAWHGGVFRQDLLTTLPPEGTPEAAAQAAFDDAIVAHRDTFFTGTPFPYVRDAGYWKLLGPVPNGGVRDKAFGPENDLSHDGATVNAGGVSYGWDTEARGAHVFIRHIFGWPGPFDKTTPVTRPWSAAASPGPASKNTTVYARAVLVSDAEREVGFWIQIDPPFSSDRRTGPNPPAGSWNNAGARVLINGREIAPPAWKTPRKGGASGPDKFRIPLTDEFYYLRPAIPVKLRKGENIVTLRLPSGGKKGEFVCTPVEWDGVNAREAKGVRFVR